MRATSSARTCRRSSNARPKVSTMAGEAPDDSLEAALASARARLAAGDFAGARRAVQRRYWRAGQLRVRRPRTSAAVGVRRPVGRCGIGARAHVRIRLRAQSATMPSRITHGPSSRSARATASLRSRASMRAVALQTEFAPRISGSASCTASAATPRGRPRRSRACRRARSAQRPRLQQPRQRVADARPRRRGAWLRSSGRSSSSPTTSSPSPTSPSCGATPARSSARSAAAHGARAPSVKPPLRAMVVMLAGLLRERGALDEAEPRHE